MPISKIQESCPRQNEKETHFLFFFTTFSVIMEHCVGSFNNLSEKSLWPLCSACTLMQAKCGTAEAIGDLCATAGLQSCLYHRKYRGKTHTAGVLWWMDTDPLQRTGWHWGKGLPWMGRATGTHRALPRTGSQLPGSSQVRIRGQTTVGSIVVDVCYKPSHQQEVDEASWATWRRLTLGGPGLHGGRGEGAENTQIIDCRNNTAEHKQPQRYLKLMNFLRQLMEVWVMR